MNAGNLFVDLFEKLTPDLEAIYANKSNWAVSDHRTAEIAKATGSGAAATVVPGAHLAAAAADIAFIMNRMAVAAYGIGAIKGRQAGFGNILEDEDFALILAYWVDDAEVVHAMSGKVAADFSSKVTSKVAVKMVSKTLAKTTGALIGKKLGGKLGAKVGAKFGAKIAGKLAGGFIPLLGAVVGGGINLYFIASICDAAERFYDDKLRNAEDIIALAS